MAVNLIKKSNNKNDEEERQQILAQMREDSIARKNEDLKAVKKVQNTLGYRYNAFVNDTAQNLVNFQRAVKPVAQSTWNYIQNQANNYMQKAQDYFGNKKQTQQPLQAHNVSTWQKVQSVNQAPTPLPNSNVTVPTTKTMEEKRNEAVKQQQERNKEYRETAKQNGKMLTEEEASQVTPIDMKAQEKAKRYAEKAEKGDYSFIFEKAGDDVMSGGYNALTGIIQSFAGLGQMATRAIGADNATSALMNFSDEILKNQQRAGNTRAYLKQEMEKRGKGGFHYESFSFPLDERQLTHDNRIIFFTA